MSVVVYVLDTSYLIELFGCGRDSNREAMDRIRKRYLKANGAGARFFVPLPCLFELGDHIADVRHDELRAKLAKSLLETVKASLEEEKPWIITPTGPPLEILPKLLARFEGAAVKRGIGLVDTFSAMEADRLREKLSDYKARVHIWTNDRNLKKLEPDPEHDPYLW